MPRRARASGQPRADDGCFGQGPHALRNAGTPIITAVGTAFIAVFGGSIIVEQILSIQGLGSWFFRGALIRDLPIVQFVAIYTAFVVVLVNLIVDLSYGFIDPRVRYS